MDSTQRISDTGKAPLRVLFLATYFPKPDNELMGPWAMKQAQALLRQGADVRVVSFTSWVPRIFAHSRGARAYAECPSTHTWGDLRVDYPRWLVYQVPPFKKWANRDPRRQMAIGWWSAKRVLEKVIREFRPDVVFAHHFAVNGYLAERLHARYGIPYVVADHDFDEVEDCRVYPKRKDVFSRVATDAFRMVACAHRMEEEFKALFPEARTMTLPCGTDPVPSEAWKTPRPPEIAGKRVVFSSCAFYARKAVPLLIRSFAAIAERNPDAVLRIAGDGDERPNVESSIQETGLGDRVQLLGFVPNSRVIQEMVWADVFALVGWDEPFGVVYLEAAAAGKPSVWCYGGGVNDYFKNEEHGLAVPPKDPVATAAALDRMLTDGQARKRMGDAARHLLETQLTWDANAKAMMDVFRAAVNQTSRDDDDATASITASYALDRAVNQD